MSLKTFLVLINLFLAFHSFGQGLTDTEWKKLKQYTAMPTDLLAFAETDLNQTIAPADCYKFIYNEDNTKCIAFFIQPADDPSYKKLTRFGHVEYTTLKNDDTAYYGYTLWGMQYEGKWCFCKDYEHLFYNSNIKSAQSNYLADRLNQMEFFKKGNRFWTGKGDNMFAVATSKNTYTKQNPGVPLLVYHYNLQHEKMKHQLLNEHTEAVACTYQDSLWQSRHALDSLTYAKRYKSKYKPNSCLALYNADRNVILLPQIYYDLKGQAWLIYYVLKIDGTKHTLYTWKKFPTKKVNRPEGKESFEVIDDIRTFIKNWNWGTNNLINTESFWAANFKPEHLQQP